jgi:pyruvate dehydrogenase E1 component alpha subunit
MTTLKTNVKVRRGIWSDPAPAPADCPAPLRFIESDGRRCPDTPLELDVTPALARSLYRGMVLGRALDQEAYRLQRQGQLGLWLSCLGQEAAQVGSITALRPTDHVFPAYREQAAALHRGLGPTELLASWRGVTHGGWDPDLYRYHLNSLVLGTQTLHATGYAFGVQLDGADEVVLAYVGDGATSQGDVNEALNWSAVAHVPIVFLCQNNQWAISTPITAQARSALHQRAAGFGLRAAYVDGNDALAVHAVTTSAVATARSGGGPAFVEAVTYRMAGHSTSDDPRRYRSDEEVQHWQERDPIERLHRFLDHEGWLDPEFTANLDAEAAELAAETRRACLALPEPMLEETFRTTLVDETPRLRREREQFSAYRASFA